MYPDPNTPPQPPQPPYPPQQLPPAPTQAPMPASAWQPPQQYDPTASLPQPQAPQLQPVGGEAAPRFNKKLLVALAGVAFVVIIGLLTYFMLSTGKSSDDDKKATTQTSDESSVISLDSLKDVTVVPPSDLASYNPNPNNTDSHMAYTTQDGSCELQLGIADAQLFPGKSLADIVSNQLKGLGADVTIGGPRNGPVLELKDATDGPEVYNLPTLIVTLDREGLHRRAYYSAAIMTDDKRVVVSRTCTSTVGPVSDDALKAINADATKITIRP